ncbi:MAG: hypothetical protein F6K54_07550 [Okeania sp. SIO3B5]|uniref:hypothetical protein n=1 Tax=Okeania sp. SIO3B5 TaxID=2607811 RepID=UPI0013FE7E16|nr:hypothetical protein [Okeania sp. SIO3B5]NEO52943.1 hypothetical protein [Okeania sp. SIO3B5]
MTKNDYTQLQPPAKNPNNIQAKKYYVFNETGNIMFVTTLESNEAIEQSARSLFNEVSVFFAGMTRAIQQTINPTTNKPYSLYNYNALSAIISGSGLFVHIQEEDVMYSTNSVGVTFSTGLIEALIGIAFAESEIGFARGLIASIGQEAITLSTSTSKTDSKAASIIFVCEYLLGMPLVSAIVVYVDCLENEREIKIGPCFQASSTNTEWKLHKDTYLFVSPSFIKQYAGDLESVNSDPQYLEMIHWLQDLVLRKPEIFFLETKGGDQVPSGSQLSVKEKYIIGGQFLPSDNTTKLKFVGGADLTTDATFTPTAITFSVGDVKQPTAAPIGVYTSASDKDPVATTPGSFSIESSANEDGEILSEEEGESKPSASSTEEKVDN